MLDTLTLLLLLIALATVFIIGQRIGAYKKNREWLEALPEHRKDAIAKSRAVLGGQFSEQLAPYLPDFNYSPTEVRFLGKPVDFLVFKGMDEKSIKEVIFVEVKSGKATLNTSEKSLKDAIQNKRVKWEEYRIPEDLTKKKDDLSE